jgi:hypothetical protein
MTSSDESQRHPIRVPGLSTCATQSAAGSEC